jgi:hypothetical protein
LQDLQGFWVTTVSTPAGLPTNLSRDQLEARLNELSVRLKTEYDVAAMFFLSE